MVNVGHAVCTDWNNGFTFDQTLADAKKGLGLGDTSSAQIIGAATGGLLPAVLQQIRLICSAD